MAGKQPEYAATSLIGSGNGYSLPAAGLSFQTLSGEALAGSWVLHGPGHFSNGPLPYEGHYVGHAQDEGESSTAFTVATQMKGKKRGRYVIFGRFQLSDHVRWQFIKTPPTTRSLAMTFTAHFPFLQTQMDVGFLRILLISAISRGESTGPHRY